MKNDETRRRRPEQRAYQARLMRERAAAARDVEIPRVRSFSRKAACRNSLLRFATTYFSRPPDADKFPGESGLLYLGLSAMHVAILEAFQERILFGGLQAVAAPRGFGKDTLTVIAALWATLYGHTRFFVFACYKQDDAAKRLDIIRGATQAQSTRIRNFDGAGAPRMLESREVHI